MNAVPDLRLILFKELQAILHVATATVMPGLNHFEAYWTVFPCETIHRATNRCSLRCEILLRPSPGGSVRDRLESPARGCKQGRDTQLPSPPLSANLCACSNENPFFLNLNSNCSEGGLPEQSEVKVNQTRASLSRKEAAWVVWDTDKSIFEEKGEKWPCMYLQGCMAHSWVSLNAINWDNGVVISLPHNVKPSTPSHLYKCKGKKNPKQLKDHYMLWSYHISAKYSLYYLLLLKITFFVQQKELERLVLLSLHCTHEIFSVWMVSNQTGRVDSASTVKRGAWWRQCSTSSLSK